MTAASPGQPNLAYRALCLVLAGQFDLVDWSAFSLADWNLLLGTAQAHRVAPLLYHVLQEAGWPKSTPPNIRHNLQAIYYATAAHNTLIYHELTRILTTISNLQSPISPILLKGIALAATLYPDPALRPLSDIDLLLPRRRLELVVQAVQSLGYREVTPEMAPGLNWPAGYHVHLRGGPHQSVDVELHWGLVAGDTNWRSPLLDWFWTQTEPWKMEGGKWKEEKGKRKQGNKETSGPRPPYSLVPFSAYQLAPTAHLLYLAAHLMLQHGGAQARLLWYYDIHLLITREGIRIDWDELLIRAREFRWSAALHAALLETRVRFDTHLPEGFLDALVENQDPEASRFVERKGTHVRTRVAGTWSELTAVDWPTRLRLAWAIACPSPDYMRWRYKPEPAWLWPFYYPYRWFVILFDGLSTLWRIGRRGRWKVENG